MYDGKHIKINGTEDGSDLRRVFKKLKGNYSKVFYYRSQKCMILIQYDYKCSFFLMKHDIYTCICINSLTNFHVHVSNVREVFSIK